MGNHGSSFKPDYKNCIALDNWLGKNRQEHNIIRQVYQNVFDKSDCLGIIIARNKRQQDGGGGTDHPSNLIHNIPPAKKHVDTTNSDGDEGGAVFL